MKSIGRVLGLLGLAASLALPASALARPRPVEIALTFDDLPAHSTLPPGETRLEIANQILAALRDAGATSVTGFVNGVQEEREPASVGVLALWRAAGHPLANHTWSHMGLSANTAADFQADLIRDEPLLEKHMAGQDWRWLRYPFLDEGDTPEKRDAVRQFLAGRDYHIASVTMNFDDWAWNEPYARCAAKGDTAAIADLEARYLQAAKDSFAASRAMSKSLHGQDIPYVLLMHEGAFDARMLPRLLAFYKSQGVRFVSLDTAERHPFYAADYRPAPTAAPTTLENALRARGLPVPPNTRDLKALTAVCLS
jgi:peptidoglycan/xylan/chitin deacetylase (PgdA/CDA1 family)